MTPLKYIMQQLNVTAGEYSKLSQKEREELKATAIVEMNTLGIAIA